MRLSIKQITAYTDATVVVASSDDNQMVCDITWDSRAVIAGCAYVALPGERVNGHTYVADAFRSGALVVLVSDDPTEEVCMLARKQGAALIKVENTAAAFTDLACAWRKHLKGCVIAVTGSSGKTTTKNLIRDVLKASFSVVATEGNQNNELGVPKTILAADPETQVIVVEMGMRGLGQIAALCEIAQPTRGLITNIGEGHIELLGSRENIARAKAELFIALPDKTGKAYMNYNDEYASFVQDYAHLAEREIETVWFTGERDTKKESATLSHSSESSVCSKHENEAEKKSTLPESWGAWAEKVRFDAQGCPQVILHVGKASQECSIPLRGKHNVDNVCAAASVGASLGMNIETIVSAIEKAKPEQGRQEILFTAEGATIIDDSYNANPDSMHAALTMCVSYETAGRRIAVLGDMGELGDFAVECHGRVGELVASLPIDFLICVGELSCYIARAACDAGMDVRNVRMVSSAAEGLAEVKENLFPEDVVLVKASRFMGLEQIVRGLVK